MHLTTHVLDAAAGRPAAGVRVTLRGVGEEEVVVETVTNPTAAPIGRCSPTRRRRRALMRSPSRSVPEVAP